MSKKITIAALRYESEMPYESENIVEDMQFYCGTVCAYLDRKKEKVISVKKLKNKFAYEVIIKCIKNGNVYLT